MATNKPARQIEAIAQPTIANYFERTLRRTSCLPILLRRFVLRFNTAYRVWQSSIPQAFKLLFAVKPTKLDITLFVIGSITSILAGILLPLQGMLYARLINSLNASGPGPDDTTLKTTSSQQAKFSIVLIAANVVVTYVYLTCWALFGERLVHRIQYAYLRALLRQEMAYFDSLPSGEILGHLDTDISAVRAGVGERLGTTLCILSFFVSAHAVSFWHAPALTWKMSGFLPLYFVACVYGPHYIARISSAVDQKLSLATSIALECLQNLPVIHAFQAADQLESHFRAKLEDSETVATNLTVVTAFQSALLCFITFASKGLAVWYGSQDIVRGNGLDAGKIVFVATNISAASLAIANTASLMNSFAAAKASFRKLEIIMMRTPKIDGTATAAGVAISGAQAKGNIELCDVTFRHVSRPECVVLDHISFTIPGGKTTAIVGKSGAGKSTIVALLCRLYDPQEGHIQLGGRNICDYNPQSLRREITVVDSNPVFMQGSVLENVAHGLVGRKGQDWSLEEVRRVVGRVRRGTTWSAATNGSSTLQEVICRVEQSLKQAEAFEFVSQLEDGMATDVRGGASLSGGQRQRIALARAFARDPSVLVLDEALSALDVTAEEKIQSRLRSIYADRTLVTITHRLAQIKDYDKIVVTDHGTVIEEGSYQDLIERDGTFARMVSLQSGDHEAAIDSACSIASQNMEPLSHDYRDVQETWGNFQSPDERKSSHGESKTQSKSIVLRILHFLKEHGCSQIPLIIIGISTTVLTSISDVIEAIMFGKAINEINNHRLLPEQIIDKGQQYGIAFLTTGLFLSFAAFVKVYTLSIVSTYFSARTKALTLRALLNQNMAWHETQPPGSLIGYITTDATILSQMTVSTLGNLLGAVLNIAATPISAFLIAWRIALILLATVPLLALATSMQTRLLRRSWIKHHRTFAQSVAIARESIDAIRTVAAFGLEEEVLKDFRASLQRSNDAMREKLTYANGFLALALSTRPAISAVTRWWGLRQVLNGHHTVSKLLTMLPTMSTGNDGVRQLGPAMAEIAKAESAAIRVLDLIELLPEANKGERPSRSSLAENHEPLKQAPSIELCQVSFAYPSHSDGQVLRELSFKIDAGSMVVLTGPNGGGKSTILHLIQGLHEPNSGSISINGKDMSDDTKTARSVRACTSLVPQYPSLFSGTISFNLSLGADMPSQEAIVQAAKDADIHSTIQSLPEGYSTPCGEAGRLLSSGQIQRLCLARALVRSPQLLLLDEPTSSLDAESESKILNVLARLKGRTTIVIVSHHEEVIRSADFVALIDAGRSSDGEAPEEVLARNR